MRVGEKSLRPVIHATTSGVKNSKIGALFFGSLRDQQSCFRLSAQAQVDKQDIDRLIGVQKSVAAIYTRGRYHGMAFIPQDSTLP